MTSQLTSAEDLRERIIADPDVILEDQDVMRALIAANERSLGHNIVDLRGVAMDRLEARLDRLEDTHRSVIAAAYENLASTNQLHRAVLKVLEAHDFESFLRDLGGPVAELLRVDTLRLVLETHVTDDLPALNRFGGTLAVAEPGFIAHYVLRGRDGEMKTVTLRQIASEDGGLHGEAAAWIRSEACLLLDFGAGRLPGLLVLGSEDPHQFRPTHGTDLLAFFAGVFERAMRRWLA